MIRIPASMSTEVRDQLRGGLGKIVFQHYFAPAEFGAPMRLCAQLTLPPGASIGEHQHLLEDEIYLVLEGSGIVRENGVESRVKAGDAVLTGQGGCHAVLNDGHDPLVIAAIIITYPQKEKS
jgi:mannose-6-phosphate isomerase-like protein (cupin superfamily)